MQLARASIGYLYLLSFRPSLVAGYNIRSSRPSLLLALTVLLLALYCIDTKAAWRAQHS